MSRAWNDALAAKGYPDHIVVDMNGNYWRDYGDFCSMCPTSADNEPVEIVATYVRVDVLFGHLKDLLAGAPARQVESPS